MTRFLFFFLLSGVLAGCGTPPIKPATSPDAAFLFGSMLIGDRKTPDMIILHRKGDTYSASNMPPRPHIYPNGSFAFVNLAPGRYYLFRVIDGNIIYNINDDYVDSESIVVKPGAFMYLGSTSISSVKHNWISGAPGSFNIAQVSSPSDAEILRGLLPHLSGTGWDERANRYLQRSARK